MFGLLLSGTVVILSLYSVLKYNGNRKLRTVGKSVMITGCDSGVGLSLAITAKTFGFHVIATCLNISGPGALHLKKKFPDILVIPMDVTNQADIDYALQRVREHLQETQTGLWGLINNAGVLVYGHFDWQVDHQIQMQIKVNFLGMLQVTKTFLPLVRKAKGRIVNITSANGHWCLPGLSVYCGTKHAVEGFSNTLRIEMIPWDVKVILVNPGNIPGNTQLLASQAQHAAAMKKSFSEEEIRIYGEYFEVFQNHLQKNFPVTTLLQQEPFDDAGLNKVLESCLLLEHPRHYYENISMGFRLFIIATKLLPTYYSDRILLRIWGSTVGYKLL